MKLAKELIKLMSDSYASNNLNDKFLSPINLEYIKILSPETLDKFLKDKITGGHYDLDFKPLDKETALEHGDISTRINLVVKGCIYLYLKEILSWTEVKKILNIGSHTMNLYKVNDQDPIGSFELIISLLSVLFNKVIYETSQLTEYPYDRLTGNKYYWDVPMYYYGHKSISSYGSFEDLVSNIKWFLDESPELSPLNKYDVLGMMRVNDMMSPDILKENSLDITVDNELTHLGYYNIALNVIKIDDVKKGLNSTLFDFYKSVNESATYSLDGSVFNYIDWVSIRSHVKYIDTVMEIDSELTNIEKIGISLTKLQNFLIH